MQKYQPQIHTIRIRDKKMNIVKIIALVFMTVLVSQLGFSQVHDENFSQPFGFDIKSVQVYPNPATDFVTIKLELPVAKRTKVALHNIIGSLLEIEMEVLDDFEIRIKTKDLPVGYYMIALRDGYSPVKGSFKFLKR